MSQTETLLLVVMGFSLAALIFLFISRFIWSIASRFGARRLQRQTPATVAGLQTERDRLRAEYARLSQKLGDRLETARMQMAEQMAEATRNRNRIEALVAEINIKDVEAVQRTQEIATLKQKIAGLEEGLAVAVTESASLRHQLPAASAAVEPAVPAQIQQRIEALASLSREISDSHSAAVAEGDDAPSDTLLQEKLAQAARDTEDLQRELSRLDAVWNERLASIGGNEAATEQEGEGGSVANVVSLANRIKALQKDVAG